MKNKISLLPISVFIILFLLCNSVYAFDVVDNTGNSTNTYSIPELSTEYQQYMLDYPYLIRAYEGRFNIYIAKNADSYFYKDGTYTKPRGEFYKGYCLNGSWEYSEVVYNASSSLRWSSSSDIYYNCDIYTDVNKTGYYYQMPFEPDYIYPYIMDSSENLSTLDMEYITIDSGNVNLVDGFFDFIVSTCALGSVDVDTVYHTKLNSDSPFYRTGGVNGDYYEIPTSVIKNKLLQGNLVEFCLVYWVEDSETSTFDVVNVVYGGSTANTTDDILNNGFAVLNNKTQELINEQKKTQETIKESNETQKGILSQIKAVVSYINPLSENFFVYKLIDLLIDALKSLFIPADDYFSNYFDELMEWFSDRLGFLAYPLELVLNILNRLLNINFSEPIISIPDIEEPTTGLKFINATDYNLNSLLKNETLKNVHDIYFIVVDAIIIFGLVNLLKHKMEEVMTK